jgi:HNH endonuclease
MSEIPNIRRIARVGISKKLRFDVFKRDGFKCQYCGVTPSGETILEVDHIRPVAEGGGNEIDNLVTSCYDCNRGKGSGLLSNVPQSLEEKAEQVREQEAQIRAYYEILEAKKSRKDEEVWSIADIFMERFSDTYIQRSRLSSIKMFLGILDYFEVLEAMEIAVDKMYTRNRAWLYFCGVCWQKIKRANGEEIWTSYERNSEN